MVPNEMNCVDCSDSHVFACTQVNHFPGTFQIGRKDRLWKNLSRLQLKVGKKVQSILCTTGFGN